jgi:hypothetical protein
MQIGLAHNISPIDKSVDTVGVLPKKAPANETMCLLETNFAVLQCLILIWHRCCLHALSRIIHIELSVNLRDNPINLAASREAAATDPFGCRALLLDLNPTRDKPQNFKLQIDLANNF